MEERLAFPRLWRVALGVLAAPAVASLAFSLEVLIWLLVDDASIGPPIGASAIRVSAFSFWLSMVEISAPAYCVAMLVGGGLLVVFVGERIRRNRWWSAVLGGAASLPVAGLLWLILDSNGQGVVSLRDRVFAYLLMAAIVSGGGLGGLAFRLVTGWDHGRFPVPPPRAA